MIDYHIVSNGVVVGAGRCGDGELSFVDPMGGEIIEGLPASDAPVYKPPIKLEVLSKRNGLLQASDWTQLPDVPLGTKSAWAEYRQALRDITDQAEYPDNVIWPTSP